jgi:hypothetical protein
MGQLYDANLLYDIDGNYDDGLPVPIVPPSRIASSRARFADAAPDQTVQRFPFATALPRVKTIRVRASAAATREQQLRSTWAAVSAHDRVVRLRIDAAHARESATRLARAGLSARASDVRITLDAAGAKLSAPVRARWSGVVSKQAFTALAWGAAIARGAQTRMPWADALAKNAFIRIRWRPGYPYRSGYTVPFGGEPDPLPGTTIVIPLADTYFMIPALSIIRDSDGADLNAIDATLSLDRTSYAWVLNATIPRPSLSLVDPNTNSEPVLVDVNVNGYPWKFIIESYSDNRKFGGTGAKIVGRSQSALLGAPYAPLSTFTSTANADASQLAADLMPAGWTLTWSTQDWLVPAGFFTYADLAPIDALALLVNAIGGAIVPDPSAQSLTIEPLYPVSPWAWDSASPYADVPASFFTELAGQWEGNFKTAYNGIYVSGQNGGVIGKVKRTGTAGDVLLPTVTDALLCVTAANTERGRIELAKADKRKTETGRMLLLPPGGSGNPGVFMPGQLIQITEPTAWAAAAWRAQIMSVQISAAHNAAPDSSLNTRQVITLERHA